MPVHEVLIPLYDGVQPLDVAGPHEALAGAARVLERGGAGRGYRVSLVAERPGPVRGLSGMQLVADGPLPESGPIGTLLVPGGDAAMEMSGADPFVGWLRRAAERAERVVFIEYDPQPPFDAGHPSKVDAPVLERIAEYTKTRS